MHFFPSPCSMGDLVSFWPLIILLCGRLEIMPSAVLMGRSRTVLYNSHVHEGSFFCFCHIFSVGPCFLMYILEVMYTWIFSYSTCGHFHHCSLFCRNPFEKLITPMKGVCSKRINTAYTNFYTSSAKQESSNCAILDGIHSQP